MELQRVREQPGVEGWNEIVHDGDKWHAVLRWRLKLPENRFVEKKRTSKSHKTVFFSICKSRFSTRCLRRINTFYTRNGLFIFFWCSRQHFVAVGEWDETTENEYAEWVIRMCVHGGMVWPSRETVRLLALKSKITYSKLDTKGCVGGFTKDFARGLRRGHC